MSTIGNKNVVKGTLVTASDLNHKFSGVTTATTGSLDNLNVRSEAIDCNNIKAPSTSGHASIQTIVLKDIGVHDNGSRPSADPSGAVALTTYNSTVGPDPAPVPISHGSGGGELIKSFVIETGQMIRVHWQVWVEDYPQHGSENWNTFGASTIGFTPPVYPCWPVWLQWRQSGVWSEVAGQTDFTDTIPLAPPFKGGPTTETAATMLIPHGCLYYASNTAGGSGSYTSRSAWHKEAGRMYRASWNYVNTGADLTIEGFRLVIDGLYHPATSGNQAQIVHENGAGGDNWSPAATDNQIQLATVNIAVLLMEQD